MRLRTPSGSTVTVRERRWPLAGVHMPMSHNQGQMAIPLVQGLNGTQDYATYVRLYKENPWCYAAVQAIATGLARHPLKVYELQSDGQRTRARSDLPGSGALSAAQKLDLRLRRPSPQVGRRRFIKSTAVDRLVFGNALWVDEGDELWRIPWRQVTVHEGEVLPILFYEVVGANDSRKFVPEDVVHFNGGDDPESPIGVSPFAALRHTLALHNALQRHLTHFFENRARPSGNLKLQPGASKDSITKIHELISEMYASPENAGRVLVTTGDFQPMTAGHDQSEIIELIRLSREEIAAAFRTPPPVLGILDKAIKSNVKELREQYVRDVSGTWAEEFEDEIDSQFLAKKPSLRHVFVEFDLSGPLRPDLEARAKAYKDLESTTTVNERRRWENLPDLDDPLANEILVPPGSVPLSKAGEDPAPAPEAAVTEDDDADSAT